MVFQDELNEAVEVSPASTLRAKHSVHDDRSLRLSSSSRAPQSFELAVLELQVRTVGFHLTSAQCLWSHDCPDG